MLRHASILVLTLLTVARAHAEPCRSGFDVDSPATVSGSPRHAKATLTASGGMCAFDVRLCVNMGDACDAQAVVAMAGRGGASALDVPDALDEPGACGAWSPMTVVASRTHPTRRRLRARVRTGYGRKRRVRLTLECLTEAATTTTTTLPPPGVCAPGSERPCEGITGRALGRRIDFPPSLPIGSCSYGTSSNYLTPTSQLDPAAPAELHMIGVYEADRATAAAVTAALLPPPAPAAIDVVVHARPKPIVLALVASESVRWNVTVEPGATIANVIASGYGPQDVRGLPAGTAVEQLGPDDAVGYFYGWEIAANEGGGGFLDGIRNLRMRTGLVETSFQGCYGGVRFEVPHTEQPPAACECDAVTGDETKPLRSVALPGCAAITAESQYCLTSAGGSLSVLGIDSGDVCALPAAIGTSPLDVTLAWRGDAVYACPYGVGLVRMSLIDGSTKTAQVPCSGVAVDDAGRLVVGMPSPDVPYRQPKLYAFDSWQDVLEGNVAADLGTFGLLERFTIKNHILYEGWHSTDTIDRTDLTTGTSLIPLKLDAYDGWILGLSVTADGRMLIPGDLWGDTVWVFDSTTGVAEGILHPTTPVMGLTCVDRQ